jgi:hypothetical protein
MNASLVTAMKQSKENPFTVAYFIFFINFNLTKIVCSYKAKIPSMSGKISHVLRAFGLGVSERHMFVPSFLNIGRLVQKFIWVDTQHGDLKSLRATNPPPPPPTEKEKYVEKKFCFSVHESGCSFSGCVQGIWISRTVPPSNSLIRTKGERISVELQKHCFFCIFRWLQSR